MPRYLVERTFPDGLAIPMTEEGSQTCLTVVGNNTEGRGDLGTFLRHTRQKEDLLYPRCALARSNPYRC